MTDLAVFGFGVETGDLVQGGKALDEFAAKGATTAQKVGRASDELNKELRGLSAAVNALVGPANSMAQSMQRLLQVQQQVTQATRAAAAEQKQADAAAQAAAEATRRQAEAERARVAELARLQAAMRSLAASGTTPLQAAMDRLAQAEKDVQAAQAAGIQLGERHRAGLAALRGEVQGLRSAQLSGVQATQAQAQANSAVTASLGAQVRQWVVAGAAAAGVMLTFQGLVSAVRAALSAMDQSSAAAGKIGSALGSLQAGREVFGKIAIEAQRTGTSANEAAGAFLRFDMAAKQIGATTDETLKLTTMLQKVAVVSGTTAQESGAAFLQLGQALASGRFQGDELRSVMESMPMLAELLAKNLGVGVGQLRTMGAEGKLTADLVFRAMLAGSAEVEKRFGMMPVTMERAANSSTQAWSNLLTVLDQNWKITSKIAEVMQAAANRVQSLADSLKTDTASALRDVSAELDRINKQRDEAAQKAAAEAARRSAGYSLSIGTPQPRQGRPSDTSNPMNYEQRLLSQQTLLLQSMEGEMQVAAQRAMLERDTRSLIAAETARVEVLTQIKEAQKALGGVDEDTQKQMKALQTVIDAGAGAFTKYGIQVSQARMMLAALEEKVDPLKRVLAGLNDQLSIAIATNLSPLEGRIVQAQQQARTPGKQQTPEELAQVAAGVRAVAEAEQKGVVEKSRLEMEAAQKALAARRQGNELAARTVEIDETVRQARERGMSAADAEIYRTNLLGKATAELAASHIKALTPVAEVRKALEEKAKAAEHEAAASALGAREQVKASQQDRARAEALKVARDGTVAYSKAYADFLTLVQREDRGKAQEDVNKRAAALKDEVALLEAEMSLVGKSREEREVEVAALRERQQLLASGKDYTDAEVEALVGLVRQREIVNQQLRRQQELWSEIENFGTRAFDRIGSAITEAFVQGKGATVTFASVARGLMSELIQLALKLMVINPLARWAMPAIGSLFFGGSGGAAGVAGAAAGAGGGAGIGDMLGLGQLLGGKSIFESIGLTGSGGVLSTPLWGGVSAGEQAFLSAAGVANPAGVGATTLGGLLGGAGAGFGAGMLLNSLLGGNQTGGMIGSGVGGLAGAAIGSFIPGIGTLIGGLIGGALGGAGGGLIGPKASVKGYGYALRGGSDGMLQMTDMFYNESGKAAFEEAAQSIAALNAYMGSKGISIGGAIGVGGNKNGPDYSHAAAGSYTEGVSKLYYSAKDAELDFALADKRGRQFADAGEMQKFVDGFFAAKDAIKALTDEPIPAFTQQMTAITTSFDAAIAKAREYGLAEDKLNAARTKAMAELEAARTETLRKMSASLSIRRMAATGDDLNAQLAQQAEAAKDEIKGLTTQLEALAVSAEDKAARLVELEEVQAAERAKIIADYGKQIIDQLRQAGGSIRSWLDQLATGTAGGASPTNRLYAAQSQFERDRVLAMGGDRDALGRITSTADAMLTAAREVHASGPEFEKIKNYLVEALGGLPAVKSYDAQQTAALEAIQAALENGTLNTSIDPSGNSVTIINGAVSVTGVVEAINAADAAQRTVLGWILDSTNKASEMERTVLGWILDSINKTSEMERTVLGWILDSANKSSEMERTVLGWILDSQRIGFELVVAATGNGLSGVALAVGSADTNAVNVGNAHTAALASIASAIGSADGNAVAVGGAVTRAVVDLNVSLSTVHAAVRDVNTSIGTVARVLTDELGAAAGAVRSADTNAVNIGNSLALGIAAAVSAIMSMDMNMTASLAATNTILAGGVPTMMAATYSAPPPVAPDGSRPPAGAPQPGLDTGAVLARLEALERAMRETGVYIGTAVREGDEELVDEMGRLRKAMERVTK